MTPNPLASLQAVRHEQGHGSTAAEKAVNLELVLPDADADRQRPPPPPAPTSDAGDTLAASSRESQKGSQPSSPVAPGAGERPASLVEDVKKSGGACRPLASSTSATGAPPSSSRLTSLGAALAPSHPGLSLLLGLSFLDRFLAFFVLLAMILGVVIGAFSIDQVAARARPLEPPSSRPGPRPTDQRLTLPDLLPLPSRRSDRQVCAQRRRRAQAGDV